MTCKVLEGPIQDATEGGLNRGRVFFHARETQARRQGIHRTWRTYSFVSELDLGFIQFLAKIIASLERPGSLHKSKLTPKAFPYHHVQLFKSTCSYQTHPMISSQVRDPIAGHKFVWEPLGGNSGLGRDR